MNTHALATLAGIALISALAMVMMRQLAASRWRRKS